MRRPLVTALAALLAIGQAVGTATATEREAPGPASGVLAELLPHDHGPGADGPPTPIAVPAADPARGVVPVGLEARSDGPCAGVLEIVDVDAPGAYCTHGPDPAPAAVRDVRTDALTPADAARIVEAAPAFACDGNGTSGRRAHAIYAVAPDRTDRFSTYAAAFRAIIAGVQDEFRQSSIAHGADDPLVYRFTHSTPSNGSCTPKLDHVVLPSAGDDDSFGATISALQGLGYTDPSRRYLVFVDATVLCGIGQMYQDDTSDPGSNWNNVLHQPLFSRVDAGCWDYAETHELAHNIGAVQDSAPNSTGAGHCNDDHDLMCYSDGGLLSSLFVRCASSWERRLDCGGDDYFHPDPPGGSYLATHWNTADSGWLFTETAGTGGSTGGSGGSSGGGGGSSPSVSISSPSSGAVVTGSVTVRGTASDPDGDLRRVKVWVDGTLVDTVTTSGSWSSRLELSLGLHTVTVKAVDAAGRTSSGRSVLVTSADLLAGFEDWFSDDDDSVFERDIARIAVEGVTLGCNPPENDRYCPGTVVTRGVMAAFLARALDLPAASGIDFRDDDSSIFESDIERLAAAGITRGCNPPANDRFCPDEPVSRGAMAAFLARALDLPAVSGIDFRDDDSSIFESDIERLAAAGITRGCNPPTNDRFCPTTAVTRGAMAAFLARALYD